MTSPAPKKADRVHINRAPKGGAISPVNHKYRAPKGGAISPVNHKWYRGGCFMPLEPEGFKAAPAKLEGSSRQVSWASRLRADILATLEAELATRRLLLADRRPVDAAGVRRAIRRDEAARYSLVHEKSAAYFIERRATFA